MASPPREGKKKEIYKYVAPWTVFAMNWSMRLDKRWRLAIGSFIEDYTNKVSRVLTFYLGARYANVSLRTNRTCVYRFR